MLQNLIKSELFFGDLKNVTYKFVNFAHTRIMIISHLILHTSKIIHCLHLEFCFRNF
jgi:hypothetical protein